MINNEIQRVVLLRKNLVDQYNAETPNLPNDATKWIALGHFDEIYTYDLPLNQSKFFLHYIKQDKDKISKFNNDQVYYHPLYLVGKTTPLFSCNGISEDNFRFIAIVRIHFASTCNQFHDYEKLCGNIISNLKKATKHANTELQCRAYHATEFSDMVIDLRAQRFNVLQEFVLKTLRNNALIGKMYTYFGISSRFMYSEEICDTDDIINMLSVRFPCTANQNQITTIKAYLSGSNSKIKVRNMYSVNGLDDTLISCNELPTNNLLKAYRYFLSNGNNPENMKSTTRIGFYIDAPLLKPKATDISILCSNLISLRNNVRNKLEEKGIIQRSWFHMIYESVNTLVRMSKTSVMDEIIYLLAPSIEAFMVNILTTPAKTINRNVALYNEYAENYVNLIEQLMRLEGQLSQNPEYRPVICDIPVFILEYTLAFLSKIAKILQHGDSGIKSFEFFMMPCSCRQITVSELFSATEHSAGVVQLSIPDQALYKPESILRPLCHEVAHNVGEKYRCRDVRKGHYCYAIAMLVSSELLDSNDNKEAVRMLTKRFKKKLEHIPNPTISQMSKRIGEDVYFLTHKGDKADLENYIRAYLSEVTDPTPVEYINRYHLEKIYRNILHRWDDIDTLFREIYADICLLKILDLPTSEYVESLLDAEWLKEEESIAYEAYAVRIFVSLTSTKKGVPCLSLSGHGQKIYEIIQQIQSEWDNRTDGVNNLSFSINTIASLIKYGEKCEEMMDNCIRECSKDIRAIQKMYKALTDPEEYLGYSFIVKSIDTYRQEVIAINRS